MLRYQSYDIVFQEIPGEVSLALTISNCPNRCKDCHSPHLWADSGEVLDEKALSGLLKKYGNAVTCVCFMGGDASPNEVERLAMYLREHTGNRLKIGWYSGKTNFPDTCSLFHFDYLKLGPYIRDLGGLDAPDTNQRFYRIENGEMKDETYRFRKEERMIERKNLQFSSI